jgi:hypothetical protein
MALKHQPIDPEIGEDALEVMFIEIRRAEKAITEAEGMDARMSTHAAHRVGSDRFPALNNGAR